MREFKLRAWHIKDEIWIPFKYFMIEDKKVHFFNIVNGKKIATILPRKDVKFVEFTGLKDKNGKEIYEGDILKGWEKPMVVKWDEDGVWAIGDSFYDSWLCALSLNNCEIIGNIFENPRVD